MKFSIYSFIVITVLMAACKGPQVTEKDRLKTMPGAFTEGMDSTSSATIIWKNYFSDPDLQALIEEGIKNNLDISMALQRIEVSKAGLRLSKGELLPTVNASAAYWQRKFGYYTMDDAGNRTTEILPGKMVPTNLPDYFLGFQASWEADVWGKLRNKKKAALSRYMASLEAKNLVVTTIIAEVANAYYELLALDNELEVIRETITIQEKALELVTYQKQTATANELAVKQFKAQLLNSRALEYETLQLITESETRINFLLGRYPQAITRNKATFNQPLAFKTEVGIPSDLLKNRPDIKQAEFELIASKADLRAAKAAFYPSLSITGSAGFQGFRADLLFQSPKSIAYSILGNLMAPILNRSAIKAAFRTANASQQEALFNYQKSILNGYVEVYNEIARIKNLEKIADFKAQEVEEYTQSTTTSNDLFSTSRANYIEVLMTQKNALDSKLQLLETKRRQYNAVVNIYKALGGGWQ